MKMIGERIKTARIAKNLYQEDLASLVGAKKSSVSTWELGKAKPDCVTFLKICKALDVTPNELLGFDSELPTTDEMFLLTKYRHLNEHGKKVVDSILNIEYENSTAVRTKKQKVRNIKINFYNFPASAGTGNFLETETPDEIYVRDTDEAENADYVIPISGDSMEPSYHDGDKVFVEKCDTIREGEIGIFIINGDAFIKELGKKCLISHNAKYRPILLRATDSVYCCGRVLGVVDCESNYKKAD